MEEPQASRVLVQELIVDPKVSDLKNVDDSLAEALKNTSQRAARLVQILTSFMYNSFASFACPLLVPRVNSLSTALASISDGTVPC